MTSIRDGRALALLALAGLLGCVDADAEKDKDGDGYIAFQAGGDDCDDNDPTVNPGAPEICGDGIDNDCDGLIDDDGIGAGTWYPDRDSDGFGVTAEAFTACTAPPGAVGQGGDCDDDDPNVNPDAAEIWYDGVDQNCDGADDFDRDGDGFRSAEHAQDGDDCDDTDPAVHPDATEICGDGIDNDCDGTHNDCDWDLKTFESLRRATLEWPVTEQVPRVTVGDADGDGAADLAVWMANDAAIRLHLGGWSGARQHSEADVTIDLPAPDAGYGYVATLESDLSGDGAADLVVGAWKPGTQGWVRVFRDLEPAQGATRAIGDAWRTWTGPADSSQDEEFPGFGTSVTVTDRGQGASASTLAVPYRSTSDTGHCLLFRGAPVSGDASTVADRLITGCRQVVPGYGQSAERLARQPVTNVHRLVDLDAPSPIDALAAPIAKLFPDGVSGVARRGAGDFDGDGHPDLLLIDTPTDGSPAGLRVAFGPFDDTHSPDRIDLIALVDEPVDEDADEDTDTPPPPRASIEAFLDAVVGDFNGDGLPDLATLVAPIDSAEPVILVLSQPIPLLPLDAMRIRDFPASWTMPPGTHAEAIHAADVDGDGVDDLIVVGRGKVWVVFGQGW